MEFKLEPFHRDISNIDLIHDLKRVHLLLRKSAKKLTFREYNEHGKFSAGTIAVRFGSWNRALEKAQINLAQERSISTDDLFDNLRTVWIANGRQPVFRDMGLSLSQYAASTYAARFGGWRNALAEFLKSTMTDPSEMPVVGRAFVPDSSWRRKRTSRGPSLVLKFRVMRRDRFMCVKCGRAPASHPGLILEIDHILAWSKGGETFEANLQTLCFDCNRGKTDSEDQ